MAQAVIILFIGLSALFFFFRKQPIPGFFFNFFIFVIALLTAYHSMLFILVRAGRKRLRKTLELPHAVYDSSLSFVVPLPGWLLFSQPRLTLKTDLCTVPFCWDGAQKTFQALPFLSGRHMAKTLVLSIGDPFGFLTIRHRFAGGTVVNYLTPGIPSERKLPENRDIAMLRDRRARDDSILIRDYLWGDDVRKILWRVLAAADEIKIRDDWFEPGGSRILPVTVRGLFEPDSAYFTQLGFVKAVWFIRRISARDVKIRINGRLLLTTRFEELEDLLFDIIETEKAGFAVKRPVAAKGKDTYSVDGGTGAGGPALRLLTPFALLLGSDRTNAVILSYADGITSLPNPAGGIRRFLFRQPRALPSAKLYARKYSAIGSEGI